jgi:hypothetical protein
VEATTGGSHLAGRFVQRAILPAWTLGLLALLVAAGAGAVVLLARPHPAPPAAPVSTPIAHPRTPPEGASATATPTAVVRVPNVVGETLSRAKELIRARGLDIGTVSPHLPSSTPVRKQSPLAGDDVEPGSAVDLVLETVAVPDLTGLTEQQADARLKKLGLGDGLAQPWDAGVDATVASQDPAAGKRVPPGEDVELTMAKPPAPEFGRSDAADVAATVADQYARGGGVTDAAARRCRAAGAQQWSCVIDITYPAQSGESNCQIRIAITPTTDLSGVETTSGLLGAYRVTETDCPTG